MDGDLHTGDWYALLTALNLMSKPRRATAHWLLDVLGDALKRPARRVVPDETLMRTRFCCRMAETLSQRVFRQSLN